MTLESACMLPFPYTQVKRTTLKIQRKAPVILSCSPLQSVAGSGMVLCGGSLRRSSSLGAAERATCRLVCIYTLCFVVLLGFCWLLSKLLHLHCRQFSDSQSPHFHVVTNGGHPPSTGALAKASPIPTSTQWLNCGICGCAVTAAGEAGGDRGPDRAAGEAGPGEGNAGAAHRHAGAHFGHAVHCQGHRPAGDTSVAQ